MDRFSEISVNYSVDDFVENDKEFLKCVCKDKLAGQLGKHDAST